MGHPWDIPGSFEADDFSENFYESGDNMPCRNLNEERKNIMYYFFPTFGRRDRGRYVYFSPAHSLLDDSGASGGLVIDLADSDSDESPTNKVPLASDSASMNYYSYLFPKKEEDIIYDVQM